MGFGGIDVTSAELQILGVALCILSVTILAAVQLVLHFWMRDI